MNDTMNEKKQLLREFFILGAGLLLGAGVMLGVFALLQKFDMTVLWGALLGVGLTMLNFFLMALSVWRAVDKAEQGDVKGGKRLMTLSMLGRYLLMALVLFAGAKSGLMHPIAMLIPLLLMRPILSLGEVFRKAGENKA